MEKGEVIRGILVVFIGFSPGGGVGGRGEVCMDVDLNRILSFQSNQLMVNVEA